MCMTAWLLRRLTGRRSLWPCPLLGDFRVQKTSYKTTNTTLQLTVEAEARAHCTESVVGHLRNRHVNWTGYESQVHIRRRLLQRMAAPIDIMNVYGCTAQRRNSGPLACMPMLTACRFIVRPYDDSDARYIYSNGISVRLSVHSTALKQLYRKLFTPRARCGLRGCKN